MGATLGQIEEAYGPPDLKRERSEGEFSLAYKSLGMSLELREGGLWMLTVSKK